MPAESGVQTPLHHQHVQTPEGLSPARVRRGPGTYTPLPSLTTGTNRIALWDDVSRYIPPSFLIWFLVSSQCAVTSQTFEDSFLPTDLYPPSGQHNPKLWQYFGYRKTDEELLEEDGAPICKLCLRKLISKGETTANMMQHLKENHNQIYTEVQVESFKLLTIRKRHGCSTSLERCHGDVQPDSGFACRLIRLCVYSHRLNNRSLCTYTRKKSS